MTINEALEALARAKAEIGGDAPLLMADGLHVVKLDVQPDPLLVGGCVYVRDLPAGGDGEEEHEAGEPVPPAPACRYPCPRCGGESAYRNVGKAHWHTCEACKVRWCPAWNLFSSWKYETAAVWEKNAADLLAYEMANAGEEDPLRAKSAAPESEGSPFSSTLSEQSHRQVRRAGPRRAAGVHPPEGPRHRRHRGPAGEGGPGFGEYLNGRRDQNREDHLVSENPLLTPPLKWHGGKSYLADRIVSLMPPHLHYVEPYFGGGQVLFARDPADRCLWWTGRTSDGRKPAGVSEVVNDLDGDLMNFYAVLKDPEQFARLRQLLDLTLFSEAEWRGACDLLAGGGGGSVERAAALFVQVRQSRSGTRKDFSSTTRTRLRRGRNDGVNAWWGAVAGLEDVHRRLKDVVVLCRPALQVIAPEDRPATLFYLDPPYVHQTRVATDAYAYEMTEHDHRQLLDALLGCKGKVMLSGYANPLYDEALTGWTRHTFDLPNHAAGGRTKRRMTEVLWCNFRAGMP